MKTLLICASALLLLSGCAATAPPPAQLSDKDFREMSNGLDFYATYNDTGLNAAAKDVCTTMRESDADTSWLMAVKLLTDQGVSGGEAGQFIVFATSARCTDMVERLPQP